MMRKRLLTLFISTILLLLSECVICSNEARVSGMSASLVNNEAPGAASLQICKAAHLILVSNNNNTASYCLLNRIAAMPRFSV
jgi:hypothetical protein